MEECGHYSHNRAPLGVHLLEESSYKSLETEGSTNHLENGNGLLHCLGSAPRGPSQAANLYPMVPRAQPNSDTEQANTREKIQIQIQILPQTQTPNPLCNRDPAQDLPNTDPNTSAAHNPPDTTKLTKPDKLPIEASTAQKQIISHLDYPSPSATKLIDHTPPTLEPNTDQITTPPPQLPALTPPQSHLPSIPPRHLPIQITSLNASEYNSNSSPNTETSINAISSADHKIVPNLSTPYLSKNESTNKQASNKMQNEASSSYPTIPLKSQKKNNHSIPLSRHHLRLVTLRIYYIKLKNPLNVTPLSLLNPTSPTLAMQIAHLLKTLKKKLCFNSNQILPLQPPMAPPSPDNTPSVPPPSPRKPNTLLVIPIPWPTEQNMSTNHRILARQQGISREQSIQCLPKPLLSPEPHHSCMDKPLSRDPERLTLAPPMGGDDELCPSNNLGSIQRCNGAQREEHLPHANATPDRGCGGIQLVPSAPANAPSSENLAADSNSRKCNALSSRNAHHPTRRLERGALNYNISLAPTTILIGQTSDMGTNTLPPPYDYFCLNEDLSFTLKMNILAWNVRGAGGTEFRRVFRDTITLLQPDAVILTETKLSGERAIGTIAMLGFEHFFKVDAMGFAGGIWLLWNGNNISIEVMRASFQEVHSIVKVSPYIPPEVANPALLQGSEP
ncbi:hypothetical protein G2W53_003441 [Senna tora]|uniref:Endonuclease/exonuclease/phosphatase domain-containing protein n=1 Tax=Senna tora TaxID=362788 RepID=A0A834XB90_9FABA|nr:hypothetical protein G2W53_003441 [Senna tora]